MISIGIIPSYEENKDRPFLDKFCFRTSYINMLNKLNISIIGILNEKTLKLVDGFIIEGGNNITLFHILVVDYAIKYDKPLIGICMGMQAIGYYDFLVQKIMEDKNKVNKKNLEYYYKKYNENCILKKVENHNKENPFTKKSIIKSYHNIYINKNTILYNIYRKNIIKVPSAHIYVLKNVSSNFRINAYDKYKNIEGIEHINNFILGLQFHPELENKNIILFKKLKKECLKRK